MLNLLRRIDEAYNLGYERQEKEIAVGNALARAKIGDAKELVFILGWEKRIKELDRN